MFTSKPFKTYCNFYMGGKAQVSASAVEPGADLTVCVAVMRKVASAEIMSASLIDFCLLHIIRPSLWVNVEPSRCAVTPILRPQPHRGPSVNWRSETKSIHVLNVIRTLSLQQKINWRLEELLTLAASDWLHSQWAWLLLVEVRGTWGVIVLPSAVQALGLVTFSVISWLLVGGGLWNSLVGPAPPDAQLATCICWHLQAAELQCRMTARS